MNVLVSIYSDKFSRLKRFWDKYADEDEGAFQGTDKTKKLGLGGLVFRLDWSTKQIKETVHVETPRGFTQADDEVIVTKGSNEVVVLTDDLAEKKRFSNPYMNNLHWVDNGGSSLFFASTALDLVLETDFSGKTVNKWFATNHGFETDPKGRKKRLERKSDYREETFPTLEQTTHLNSVMFAGETKYYDTTVYVSLFHQGQIIAIDWESGEYQIVLDGLTHPHAVRRRQQGDGFLVSDTEGGRCILTDEDFEVDRVITVPEAEWIQDSYQLRNGNILVCDANNHAIKELDEKTGSERSVFSYDEEWKIFSVEQDFIG